MTAPRILDLQTDVALVQAALALPNAQVAGTSDYGLVFATLEIAQARLTLGARTAESYLASLVAIGVAGDGFFAHDTAANAAIALNAAASLAGYLAFSAPAAGYLGRIARNLANAST